jgi:hypothetical protein
MSVRKHVASATLGANVGKVPIFPSEDSSILIPPLKPGGMMANLVVCWDGIWSGPDERQEGVPTPTNVIRIYNALAPRDVVALLRNLVHCYEVFPSFLQRGAA